LEELVQGGRGEAVRERRDRAVRGANRPIQSSQDILHYVYDLIPTPKKSPDVSVNTVGSHDHGDAFGAVITLGLMLKL
jgi:hypothetical protein